MAIAKKKEHIFPKESAATESIRLKAEIRQMVELLVSKLKDRSNPALRKKAAQIIEEWLNMPKK